MKPTLFQSGQAAREYEGVDIQPVSEPASESTAFDYPFQNDNDPIYAQLEPGPHSVSPPWRLWLLPATLLIVLSIVGLTIIAPKSIVIDATQISLSSQTR